MEKCQSPEHGYQVTVKHLRKGLTYSTMSELDNGKLKETTYCNKCLSYHYEYQLNYQCEFCKNYTLGPFFSDPSNLCFYCFKCLDFRPDECWEWKDDRELVKDLIYVSEDDEIDLNYKYQLHEIVDLLMDNLDVPFKLWRDRIHARIKEKTIEDEAKKSKEKLLAQSIEYTKMSRVEDALIKYMPELDAVDARYTAKRLDVKNYNLDEFEFDNAEKFLHFLIKIKPLIQI